ncbi:transglycosylase domain-containing protein [Croceicoccus marinus]|jgi:penicillin-binding protein 1A|uniref:PBP1A family penicillin-binding protein n=1 Tax=Croceicoccus marinus TaxID=450378 RepID=A0A7G6VVH2_9SPHN|nr:PBP1A family penicillin-binding protein [Croceicoccus marinus]QNE05737.1 PBP1A family penicillin-binding protein [Croceicoccus marinus]
MASNGKRRSSGSGRESRNSDQPKKRWWLRILVTLFGIGVLAAIGLVMAVLVTMRSLPSYSTLKASEHGQMIVVRARDGRELVSIGPSYGEWLDAREIPEVMKNAMVAVEDRRFYDHWGVDPIGVLRSLMVRVQQGYWRQGGSTITQQLARNIFLNNNKTFDRKVREAILALALEQKFSKDQILELYLNKVYFGGGAYGVDSASRLFFSHPATDLRPAEAAIIAGLVKAPSRYSPTADANAAISRAAIVLRLMEQEGYISPSEAAAIDVSTVKLKEEHGQNSVRYFTDWVLPQLDFLVPDSFEPIEVWTTLDVGMQRAATTAIKSNVPSGAQGALVSLDRDGAVLALVGGTDYVETNYNRATQAQRQPGSAWKLFVYLAALEAGYTPDSPVFDRPITIDGWTPRNSGGTYAGKIDVRAAFAYSKNTVAAQLGESVGFGTVASMARRFGITSPISTYPSMVLGASEVRLIDLTGAFAAVQAEGRSVEPYGITRVTTADGELLYERQRGRQDQLVAPYVAAQMTDLLQTAVNTGTGRAAQIGRPAAGKTGTTSSNKDGWFMGFSSGITTGVWMGRDDNARVGGLQGGTAPARAWAAYMRIATDKRPVEEFNTELTLPEWQLEPDDEAWFGGEGGDYYFFDEDGNPIDPYGGDYRAPPDDGMRPGDRGERGGDEYGYGPDGYRDDYYDDGYGSAPPSERQPEQPRGIDQDFLDRATGREDRQLRRDPPPGSRQPVSRQQGAAQRIEPTRQSQPKVVEFERVEDQYQP